MPARKAASRLESIILRLTTFPRCTSMVLQGSYEELRGPELSKS